MAGCTAVPTVAPTGVPVAPTDSQAQPTAGLTRLPTPFLISTNDVPIEVTGRAVRVTTTPRHVVRVSVADAPLAINVMYPGSLANEEADVNIIQPSSVSWSITLTDAPDSNTFSFGLLGYEPGFMTVEIKTVHYAPVRFSVNATAGAGTPAAVGTPVMGGTPQAPAAGPTPVVGTAVAASGSPAVGQTPAATGLPDTAAGNSRSLTLDNNGQTITLHTGERFLLNLGSDYDWSVTPADPAILSRVVNIATVRGAQGVYEAHAAGRTTLTANGDPVCRKSQPPCAALSRQFEVQVVVQ